MQNELLFRFQKLQRAIPRAKADITDCFFYHQFDLPNGGTVQGPADYYDLRGEFDYYIGNQSLQGKTVLDIGTASGFLAFSAEEAGAASILAFDSASLLQQQRVPFVGESWHEDKLTWVRDNNAGQKRMFNAFWFMWHEKKSSVEMTYGALDDLYYTDEKFDVVLAGALIEHLSDPVLAIGHFARLAREKVIMPFTPVHVEPGEYMKPMGGGWVSTHSYVWWVLSKDLYCSIFRNLGFEVEFKPVEATFVQNGERIRIPRFTLIAYRP